MRFAFLDPGARAMRVTRTHLNGVLATVVTSAIILGGCRPKPTSPSPPGAEPLLKAKADVTMEAREYQDAMLKDARGFVARYGDKVIDLTGTVEGYEYLPDGDRGHLVLNPGMVKLTTSDPHPMAKAMPGQKVTLRGKWKPGRGIEKWVIAAVEGPPPPTLSVEELVKAWKADGTAAMQKYTRKYLILTGTVQRVAPAVATLNGTTITATLRNNDAELECALAVAAHAAAERNGWLIQGRPVRVMGLWHIGSPNLALCVVLPPQN
jgi:hypothetical protein